MKTFTCDLCKTETDVLFRVSIGEEHSNPNVPPLTHKIDSEYCHSCMSRLKFYLDVRLHDGVAVEGVKCH